MGTQPNYYDVLDISPDATSAEIKQAYRNKAKTHHPDISDNPNAHKQFDRITDAKEILLDTEKRREHDQTHNLNTSTSRNQPSSQSPSSPRTTSSRTHSRTNTRTTRRNNRNTRNTTNNSTTNSESNSTSSNKQRHRKRSPDPDNWVGSPQWSENSTDSPHETTPENTRTTTLKTVIPDTHFTETTIISLGLYTLLFYFVITAPSPLTAIPLSVAFLSFTVVLSATRAGLYTYPLLTIILPTLTLSLGHAPLSLFTTVSVVLPVTAFITTLVATSVVKR